MSDIFVAESPTGKPHRVKDEVFLFPSLSDCKAFISQVSDTKNYRPRRATPEERSAGRLIEVKKDRTGVGIESTAQFDLVSVHEDFGGRRFAISSRAPNESEFVVELAKCLADLPDVEARLMEVRYRELLPLIVDMCCKYRGYKAEKVHEQVLLVAGDLEMPRKMIADES